MTLIRFIICYKSMESHQPELLTQFLSLWMLPDLIFLLLCSRYLELAFAMVCFWILQIHRTFKKGTNRSKVNENRLATNIVVHNMQSAGHIRLSGWIHLLYTCYLPSPAPVPSGPSSCKLLSLWACQKSSWWAQPLARRPRVRMWTAGGAV